MISLNDVSLYQMNHIGYSAKIMKSKRLKGEEVFGLPSGESMKVIPLDCLPGCPDEWIKDAGSYIVPVESECGIWFDWTTNKNDTAIIASIKGINPITGIKIDQLELEQYREKCPIHKKPFSHNLFCGSCGYEWPGQNFISWPNALWWDGFRQPDGTVRQFFFTSDEIRDVASALIGKENTVPAFGFAFFRSKNERLTNKSSRPLSTDYFGSGIWDIINNPFKPTYKDYFYPDHNSNPVWICDNNNGDHMISNTNSDYRLMKADTCCSVSSNQLNYINDVSIGAGAKIDQKIEIDTLPLSEWFSEPQALIRLYFVFKDDLDTIIRKGGIKKLESIKNGYLSDKVLVG
jgi:hypothetical protein